MAATQFAVGERVRLRNAIRFVRTGSVGTIRPVFRYIDDVYDVQFDRLAQPLLIYARDLECVDAPSDSPSVIYRSG